MQHSETIVINNPFADPNTAFKLSKTVIEKIDNWLTKFPADQRQSAVLYSLRVLQEEQGWLSDDMIHAVANHLRIPPIAAFEAATFYSMYQLTKAGHHKISICNSISCMLCGSEQLLRYVDEKYGVKPNEISADQKFYLKKVECLAACAGAPAVLVDDKHYYEKVTPEQFDAIIAGLE